MREDEIPIMLHRKVIDMAKTDENQQFLGWHDVYSMSIRQTKLETRLRPKELLTSSAGRANPALWLLKNPRILTTGKELRGFVVV
jgi:hypothetical protein